MAISSPKPVTDPYNQRFTWWVDGLHIYQQVDAAAAVNIFDQPITDSPIAASRAHTGRLLVTYFAADGSRLTQYSDRDGDAGTWSAL